MVLVGVGQHQAGQPIAPGLDEGRVGHQDIDARLAFIGEGDAEVDHEPTAVVAVEVEVHVDLAGAAQGQEPEIARARLPGHGLWFW